MRLEYLVKKGEEIQLPQNEIDSFENLFKLFTSPFMDENNLDFEKIGILAKRDNKKAVFIVKNDHEDLYNGDLWNDFDVEMIANMDYMYCLPSWDWWINPQYDSKKYKVENLNHIPNKYGNSVIFVNNNKKRENNFKKILNKENFKILDVNRQYEKNNLEFFMFYDYYSVFLPLKLAREINRVERDVEITNPKKIHFILSGGFLISELMECHKWPEEFIMPSKFDGEIEEKYFIDDCIVMTRNLKKIGIKKDSKFYLSCIDSAIPKRIYQKEFCNASFNLPDDLLSMFSCRIFEKNPMLIGVDYKNNGIIYYNNLVRKKFIREIKKLKKMIGLNEVVLEMANDLFNYRTTGFRNKLFEKLEIEGYK